MHRLTALIVASLMMSAPVHAESVVLIAHRDSTQGEIKREEAADLLLGKRRTLNGQPVNILDISDERLQEIVYLEIAEMSLIRVKAYWARLVFSGQGRPPPRISPAEAVDRISQDKSAITYAYASAIPRNSKVLLRLQ
jgi:hypothetical protein